MHSGPKTQSPVSFSLSNKEALEALNFFVFLVRFSRTVNIFKHIKGPSDPTF